MFFVGWGWVQTSLSLYSIFRRALALWRILHLPWWTCFGSISTFCNWAVLIKTLLQDTNRKGFLLLQTHTTRKGPVRSPSLTAQAQRQSQKLQVLLMLISVHRSLRRMFHQGSAAHLVSVESRSDQPCYMTISDSVHLSTSLFLVEITFF